MDTRKTDALGRIVIPKDLMIKYGIVEEGSDIDIIPTDDGILLRKHGPSCIICGSTEDLVSLDHRRFCRSCINKLADLIK